MPKEQDIIHLPHQQLDYKKPEMMSIAIYRNFREVEHQLSLLQGYVKQATDGGVADLLAKAAVWDRAGSINSDGTFSTDKLRGVINTDHNEIWAGATRVISGDNLMQVWQEGRADNVDDAHPLELHVYLPPDTASIARALLRFRLLNFRAYLADMVEAGSHAHVVTDDFSSGAHDHTDPEDGSHLHTLGTESAGAHSHGLTYGMYTGTAASDIGVKINAVDVTTELGGPFAVDQTSLDIASYLEIGEWNVIELSSSSLGRVEAVVFLQVLIGLPAEVK